MANGDGTVAATNVPASPTGVYTATVTDIAGNTSELMFDSANVHPARPVATITTPINFGEVKVNAPSQARQIVIVNTGNAPLILSSCVVQKCNPQDRDDTAAFSISNCPITPINPGQQVTLNVVFTPKGCGAAVACLAFVSNAQLQQPLQSQLTGTGTGFAEAKVTLEGNATDLRFGPVRARAKSRKLNKRPLRTFTIQNVGCDTLTLTGVAINRTGRAVDNGRITNTDDSKFFSVSVVNADGVEVALSASLPLNIAQGQTRTFRVRFNPVIPSVADRTRGLSADFVLPDLLTSQITITRAGGVSSTIPLVASVSGGVQLINPADPTLAPQVTLTRLGDDIVVDFSAYDPNLDVNRATYAFFDSAGRAIDQPIEIDLTQAIAESNLVQGQSFTISHRFTGDTRRVASVRVTVFDRGSSDTAASGARASASGAVSPSSAQRFTLLLPAVRIGPGA